MTLTIAVSQSVIENLNNQPNFFKKNNILKNTTLSLSLRHVTVHEFKKIILDFKNDKAAGGELNRQILKNTSVYLKFY